MKLLILAICSLPLASCAHAQTRTLMLNTNSVVVAPTDFWSKNSNAINAVVEGGTGSAPPPAYPDNTAFVDPVTGDDITGELGNLFLPYSTVQGGVAAVVAAGGNGVVDISPGIVEYDRTGMLTETWLTNHVTVRGSGPGVTIIDFVPYGGASAHSRAFGTAGDAYPTDGNILEDFTLQCNASDITWSTGGKIDPITLYGPNHVVRNVVIVNKGGHAGQESFGVFAKNFTNLVVENVRVEGSLGNNDTGICLMNGARGRVDRCTVDGDVLGFNAAGWLENCRIMFCTATNVAYGFHQDTAGSPGITGLTLFGNNFVGGTTGSRYGTRGINMSRGVFNDLTIAFNRTKGFQTALSLTNTTASADTYWVNTRILWNDLWAFTRGIDITTSTNVSIIGNTLYSWTTSALAADVSGAWGYGNTGPSGVLHPLLPNDLQVNGRAYSSSWNGSKRVPNEDDIYDKIESLVIGGGSQTPWLSTIDAAGYDLTGVDDGTITNLFGKSMSFGSGGFMFDPDNARLRIGTNDGLSEITLKTVAGQVAITGDQILLTGDVVYDATADPQMHRISTNGVSGTGLLVAESALSVKNPIFSVTQGDNQLPEGPSFLDFGLGFTIDEGSTGVSEIGLTNALRQAATNAFTGTGLMPLQSYVDGAVSTHESDTLSVHGISDTSTLVTAGSAFGTDNRLLRSDGTGRGSQATGLTVGDTDVLNGALGFTGYGYSKPAEYAGGTIAGGGTLTIPATNNLVTATFSGATATIALPASPLFDRVEVKGLNTYGSAIQVITISGASIPRLEFDSDTALTTITNAASSGGKFRVIFYTKAGAWDAWSAVGDALAPEAGSGIANVVEDTTPQLGGDLDVNGNRVGSPDGTDGLDIVNGAIDVQTANSSRMDITDSGVRLGGANARITTILDEDNMASDSATAVPTQQSVKAYADTKQAGDADLTTWAGVTPGTGVATALAVNVGSAGAMVVNGGALGTPSSGTLTSATGLPISTGVSGLGTGVATALAANVNGTGGPLTTDGTATMTGKTFDSAGTGNVLKQTKELKLRFSDSVYALTMLPNTNNPAAATFMRPVFADDAATNANYITWITSVPADFDTSVAPTARLYFRLMGADTGTHNYMVGFADVATSAALAATPGTWISMAFAGDASGADGDLEMVDATTLTAWNSGLTAKHGWMIRIARDGPGTEAADSSTVDSEFLELVITYTSTQ